MSGKEQTEYLFKIGGAVGVGVFVVLGYLFRVDFEEMKQDVKDHSKQLETITVDVAVIKEQVKFMAETMNKQEQRRQHEEDQKPGAIGGIVNPSKPDTILFRTAKYAHK